MKFIVSASEPVEAANSSISTGNVENTRTPKTVQTAPPTSSVNDLLNQNQRDMPKVQSSQSFVLAEEEPDSLHSLLTHQHTLSASINASPSASGMSLMSTSSKHHPGESGIFYQMKSKSERLSYLFKSFRKGTTKLRGNRSQVFTDDNASLAYEEIVNVQSNDSEAGNLAALPDPLQLHDQEGMQRISTGHTFQDEGQSDNLPSTSFSMTWYKGLSIAIGTGCFLAVASSSPLFLGISCGSFVTYVLLKTYTWLLNPDVVVVYLPSATDNNSRFKYSPLQNLPRNTNESVEQSVREFQKRITYPTQRQFCKARRHVSETEETIAVNIPKRATWNESTHDVTFVQQIQVDMRNYAVELQPNSLGIPRLFSKRYPICLIHKRAVSDNRNTQSHFLGVQGRIPDVIVLFSRTGREKEEWYKSFIQSICHMNVILGIDSVAFC
ncbi:TEX2 [Bugula neritina]|uniref:TEX2 n=1 Tax=Bugula neritina TaxID=10212 RepID=A0A7J7KD87_BUGNE|nr:TEX2 [Bugula neritina]